MSNEVVDFSQETASVSPEEIPKKALPIFESAKDEHGNEVLVLQCGPEDPAMLVNFGKNGKRHCSVISRKVSFTSEASVMDGRDVLLSASNGKKVEQEVPLKPMETGKIKSVFVKQPGTAGYKNVMPEIDNPQELKDLLANYGIQMTRAEQGVLAGKSDFVFRTGEGCNTTVSIGENEYIRSEGKSTLNVSEGMVVVESSDSANENSVVINIA